MTTGRRQLLERLAKPFKRLRYKATGYVLIPYMGIGAGRYVLIPYMGIGATYT